MTSGVRVTYASEYFNDSTHVGPEFAGHAQCQAGPSYYRGFDALAPGQEGGDAVLHLNKDGQTALVGLVTRWLPILAL